MTIDLKPIIPILKANDAKFAGIFGSYAKGKAKKNSDIDILVKFSKPKSLLTLSRLERLLTKILKNKVDLVTEKSLSPYIRKQILQDLKMIYGKR